MKIRSFLTAYPVKTDSGAVTVEYAVVFPVVIICIMLLIYIGMLYYQQCLIQSVVSRNVRSMALLWGYDPEKVDINEGVTDKYAYVNESLYWQLFTDVNSRKEKTVRSVQDELTGKSVIRPPEGFDIEVKYTDFLIYKKVGIRVRATYPLPFANLFRLAGSSGCIRIDAYSETLINDPRDFMENIDYILQIYEESGASEKIAAKLKPLADALQSVKKMITSKANQENVQ